MGTVDVGGMTIAIGMDELIAVAVHGHIGCGDLFRMLSEAKDTLDLDADALDDWSWPRYTWMTETHSDEDDDHWYGETIWYHEVPEGTPDAEPFTLMVRPEMWRGPSQGEA